MRQRKVLSCRGPDDGPGDPRARMALRACLRLGWTQTGPYFSTGQLPDMGKGGPWGGSWFEGADFSGAEEQLLPSVKEVCALLPSVTTCGWELQTNGSAPFKGRGYYFCFAVHL